MKDKTPPDNEWLRQGSSGPVPVGQSTHAGEEYRNLPPIPVKELKRISDVAWGMWKRGEPVFRAVAALRIAATVSLFDHKVPTDLKWLSDFFDPESWLYDPFTRMTSLSAGPDNHHTLNATLCFTAFQSLRMADTPSWFELRDGLAHALLATKLRGVRPEDIKLPLPGFYIELPAGLMTLYNNLTGEHEVRALCVCEGYPQEDHAEYVASFPQSSVPYKEPKGVGYGRRLLIVAFCEPNENSENPEDDNILYFSLPVDDERRTIEELMERDHEIVGPDWRDDKIGGTFAGVKRTNLQLRNVLRSFVVNFLLYLASSEADVTHKHADRIRALRKGKGRKSTRVRQAVERLRAEPFWVVGSHVVVDPGVRESVRHAGTARGPQKAVNVQVMGFWRRQWAGPKSPDKPKGTKSYPKWIKPFVRNKVEGQPVLGHEYKVKGSRK